MDALRVSHQFAQLRLETLDVIADEETILPVGQDGGRRRAFDHDGRRMQCGRLAHDEGRVVIQGREEEQVGGGIELLDALALGDVADEGHLAVEALLGDQLLHRLGGVAGPDEEHTETLVLDRLQGVDDEADVLLPDVLSDEEQDELVLAYAHGFAGLHEVFLRIIRTEVAAVVHDLHLAFVTVFADHFLDRGLRHPDLVHALVEGNDALDDQVHDALFRDDAGEIVAVFGVESGDARDVLQFRDALRRLPRAEGAMGVHDLETAFRDGPQEGRIHLRDAGDIGFAEGDGDGEKVDDIEIVHAVVRTRDIRRDHRHVTHHLLHPVGIIADTDGHPVHHGREAIVEQTDVIGFFHGLAYSGPPKLRKLWQKKN